jgi:hypothetical protein
MAPDMSQPWCTNNLCATQIQTRSACDLGASLLGVFVLPAFTHGAKATACATSGAIVVAQRPSMCHGYIVVAHCFASASRLRHVWVSLFLLVKGTQPRRTCAFIGLGWKFTKTQFAVSSKKGNHIGVR